jgi:hypothetical protein
LRKPLAQGFEIDPVTLPPPMGPNFSYNHFESVKSALTATRILALFKNLYNLKR